MSLKICSFASGSSGNSYLVKTDDTNLLIDVGIAGKRIIEGLSMCKVSLEKINGILVTHEHGDHIKSLRMMCKKTLNSTIYTSEGTKYAIGKKFPQIEEKISTQDSSFLVGDIRVNPIALSHDAEEPIGFSLESKGRKVTIITDTGVFSREMVKEAATSDLLVLEANHEVNILHCGSYPYELKRRILSDHGHLSNETASEFIYEMINFKKEIRGEKLTESNHGNNGISRILLAHLSRENNSPIQATLTIKNRLYEEDLIVDRDFKLDVALHDAMSPLLEI
ncbi:MBL fold metallo-hydrolase [Eubacteriales bacterium KG127]